MPCDHRRENARHADRPATAMTSIYRAGDPHGIDELRADQYLISAPQELRQKSNHVQEKYDTGLPAVPRFCRNVASHADGFAGCRVISTDCPVTAFASLTWPGLETRRQYLASNQRQQQFWRGFRRKRQPTARQYLREERSSPQHRFVSAKHPAPESIKMPRAKPADVQPAAKTAADFRWRADKNRAVASLERGAPAPMLRGKKSQDSSPAACAGSNQEQQQYRSR